MKTYIPYPKNRPVGHDMRRHRDIEEKLNDWLDDQFKKQQLNDLRMFLIGTAAVLVFASILLRLR